MSKFACLLLSGVENINQLFLKILNNALVFDKIDFKTDSKIDFKIDFTIDFETKIKIKCTSFPNQISSIGACLSV